MPWQRRPGLAEPVQILHWPEADAALHVGTWWHARRHIPASVELAVKCADFPVACVVDTCMSWWLNINYWGEQEPTSSGVEQFRGPGVLDWYERMRVALESAADKMLWGWDVLSFCRHGKHRSGALAAVFLALVLNLSTWDARQLLRGAAFGHAGTTGWSIGSGIPWIWTLLCSTRGSVETS